MITIVSGTLRALVVVAGLTFIGASHAAGDVRQLEWDDLIPKGWDPFAELGALRERSGGEIADDSPEADALMRKFLTSGRSAPVVGELDGQAVKLPGYVVPLDFQGQDVTEFLLVPYFGACIHVPPPPANQIVYVKSAAAYRLGSMFDAVWVTGTLQTQTHLNDIGDAGYTLEASMIEAYR